MLYSAHNGALKRLCGNIDPIPLVRPSVASVARAGHRWPMPSPDIDVGAFAGRALLGAPPTARAEYPLDGRSVNLKISKKSRDKIRFSQAVAGFPLLVEERTVYVRGIGGQQCFVS